VRAALLCALILSCGPRQEEDTRPWELVFQDEFDGNALDTSVWTIETGSNFGTQQKDYDRAENIEVKNGHLVITARKEAFGGEDYTSGRMKTAGKKSWTYGRFEARMRIPHGQGMWPAFWLLGADFEQKGWPDCGEIDVMENRGSELSKVHGSLHGPGYSGGSSYTQAFTLKEGVFHEDFHVFAIEWEPKVIRWYVDGELYQTRSAETFPRSKRWVFDRPFFMIVNLAVGGMFGGDPDSRTVFPQTLDVDWVRVYARGGP
jgi:beta-glucanase (GH16 family)